MWKVLNKSYCTVASSSTSTEICPFFYWWFIQMYKNWSFILITVHSTRHTTPHVVQVQVTFQDVQWYPQGNVTQPRGLNLLGILRWWGVVIGRRTEWLQQMESVCRDLWLGLNVLIKFLINVACLGMKFSDLDMYHTTLGLITKNILPPTHIHPACSK